MHNMEQTIMYWHIERLEIKKEKIRKKISDNTMFRIESPKERKALEEIYLVIKEYCQIYKERFNEEFVRPYNG